MADDIAVDLLLTRDGIDVTSSIVGGRILNAPAGDYVATWAASSGALPPVTKIEGLTVEATPVAQVPTIIGSIADRAYTVGQAVSTTDLRTKFTGATSYVVSPTLPWVFINGYNLVFDASSALEETAFEVRGVNADGQSEPVTFALTISVAQQAPSVQTAPTITGNTTVGSILTRTAGTATAIPTPSRATVWLRNGEAIPGQTGNTLDTSGFAADDAITTCDVWNNSQGSASGTSEPWTLTVQPGITATISPNPLVAGQPFTITFNALPDTVNSSVTLSGTGLTRTGVAPSDANLVIGATKAGYEAFAFTGTVVPTLALTGTTGLSAPEMGGNVTFALFPSSEGDGGIFRGGLNPTVTKTGGDARLTVSGAQIIAATSGGPFTATIDLSATDEAGQNVTATIGVEILESLAVTANGTTVLVTGTQGLPIEYESVAPYTGTHTLNPADVNNLPPKRISSPFIADDVLWIGEWFNDPETGGAMEARVSWYDAGDVLLGTVPATGPVTAPDGYNYATVTVSDDNGAGLTFSTKAVVIPASPEILTISNGTQWRDKATPPFHGTNSRTVLVFASFALGLTGDRTLLQAATSGGTWYMGLDASSQMAGRIRSADAGFNSLVGTQALDAAAFPEAGRAAAIWAMKVDPASPTLRTAVQMGYKVGSNAPVVDFSNTFARPNLNLNTTSFTIGSGVTPGAGNSANWDLGLYGVAIWAADEGTLTIPDLSVAATWDAFVQSDGKVAPLGAAAALLGAPAKYDWRGLSAAQINAGTVLLNGALTENYFTATGTVTGA